jgi:hypothetical protein
MIEYTNALGNAVRKLRTSLTIIRKDERESFDLTLHLLQEQCKDGKVKETKSYGVTECYINEDGIPMVNDDVSDTLHSIPQVMHALRVNKVPMPHRSLLEEVPRMSVQQKRGKHEPTPVDDPEKVSWATERVSAMLGDIITEIEKQKAAAKEQRAKSALKRETAKATKATEKVAKTTKKLSAEKAEAEAAIAALTARLAELNRAETAADRTPEPEDDDDDDESYDSFDPNYCDDGGDYKDHTDV